VALALTQTCHRHAGPTRLISANEITEYTSSLGRLSVSVAFVVPVTTLHPRPPPESILPRTMARLPVRTLTLARPEAVARLGPSRALSSKVEFVEIDLSEESAASSGGAGGSVDDAAAPMRMQRLEDAIHGVLVRRAAPDWLPFVPGGSYWVPPIPRQLGVADLLGGAVYTSKGGGSVLTKEEAMCLTTPRGWPSAAYFVEGEVD
jgi:hypothetical protein